MGCVYINRWKLKEEGIGEENFGWLSDLLSLTGGVVRRSSGIASGNSGATDHDPSVVQRP